VETHAVLDLVACVGGFALGCIVLLQPLRNPLIWPLGLLGFDLFLWNFADFAFTVSREVTWHLLDLGVSPFSPALGMHVICTFVGPTPRRRLFMVVVHTWAFALSVGAWLAFWVPPARVWIDSLAYSACFAGLNIVGIAAMSGWLLRHLRGGLAPEELARTRTMLAGMLIGGVFGTTDLADDFVPAIPALANIGTLSATVLFTLGSLRFRFFERNVQPRVVAAAAVLALSGLLGYLALFYWMASNAGAIMVGTITLTLLLVAALRRLARSQTERRVRVEALVGLGRFAAQMTHDLKNPLAALKGAVQFLKEEMACGRSLHEQAAFLDLLLHQIERVSEVVEGYARLGRMQPEPSRTDLNGLVRDVLALQTYVQSNVALTTDLSDGALICRVDTGLVTRALENLVRNAVEAMPDGGSLLVRTALARSRSRTMAAITVQDSGHGIDARLAAQAFDDFFTTKAQGSGLGLAFVRRVARSHGGTVELASKPGEGTTVTLRFPVVQEGHPA
jgi:two-component system, NtrC family, sensor histidine kinase HydH